MRFNRSAWIASLLAYPSMMLVELGMLRIELMPKKIMPIADATVAS